MSMKASIRTVLLIGALSVCHVVHAAQGPTEDSLWYYEIGGAEPVSVPANPAVVSVTLGGSAQLGLGYSCGKFDPVAAVTNTLNDIGAGVDNMMAAMTAAATSAIAALPALILQRANPGLYDLFQNALIKAEETMQLATKSCEQMEADLEQWEQELESESVVLCQDVLGIEVGDVVVVEAVKSLVRVEVEGMNVYTYEDHVMFTVWGRRFRKDGLPGKRIEHFSIVVGND